MKWLYVVRTVPVCCHCLGDILPACWTQSLTSCEPLLIVCCGNGPRRIICHDIESSIGTGDLHAAYDGFQHGKRRGEVAEKKIPPKNRPVTPYKVFNKIWFLEDIEHGRKWQR